MSAWKHEVEWYRARFVIFRLYYRCDSGYERFFLWKNDKIHNSENYGGMDDEEF